MADPRPSTHQRLAEVARVFLTLGATAFGGPAAHLALMEAELVTRRAWVTREEFLDLLAAVNLIPGPNSTEMAIHLGYRRAGWPGLVTAGVCFILPAFLLVSGLALLYRRHGHLPPVAGALHGVQPVLIAILVQALWGLGRTALKNRWLALVAAGAIGGAAAGLNELVLLLLGGLLALAGGRRGQASAAASGAGAWVFAVTGALPAGASGAVAAGVGAAPFSLPALGWFFLKVGSVLFGSGYVLLAFLETDLVDRWGWLTRQQLLDAVAVGQVTPGPLLTTATFIGQLLGGFPGALIATVAIFLPAFVLVALSGPLIPRLRRSPVAGTFLDGVIAASMALMAVVTLDFGRTALASVPAVLTGLASAVALLRFRVNATWLVALGAVGGWVWSWR